MKEMGMSEWRRSLGHPATSLKDAEIARRERMLRELHSDLATMVCDGDITEQEANEWLCTKQDQWFGGEDT
jgi:hypothetical protein